MNKSGGKNSQDALSRAAKKTIDAIGKKIGVGEAAEAQRFRKAMRLTFEEDRSRIMENYILNGDMGKVDAFNEKAKDFGVHITGHDIIIMDGQREYLIQLEIEAFEDTKSQYIASGGNATDLERIKENYNSRKPAVKNFEYANKIVEKLLVTPPIEKQWKAIIAKAQAEERMAKKRMESKFSAIFLADKFHAEKALIIKEYLSLDGGMTEAVFEQKTNEHNKGVSNVEVLIGFGTASEKLKFSSDEVESYKETKLENLKQDIQDKYLAREMDEADLESRVREYNEMGKSLDIIYDDAELLGLRQTRLELEKNEISAAYLAGKIGDAQIQDRFDDHNERVLAVLSDVQAERFLFGSDEIEELMSTRFDKELERLSLKREDVEKQFLQDGQEGPIHVFNHEIDELQVQGMEPMKITDERIEELFAIKLKTDAVVVRPRAGAHRSPEVFHKPMVNKLMKEKAAIIEDYLAGNISDDKIHKIVDAHDKKVSNLFGDDSAALFQQEDLHELNECKLMKEKASIIEDYHSGKISEDKIYEVVDAHDKNVSNLLGDDSAAKFQEEDFHQLLYQGNTGSSLSE
jgi:hypothetical protein